MITNGAILLTEKILGVDDIDVVQTLKQIAVSNNLKHIAHLRFVPKKSSDLSLLTSTVTYPIEWQHRYFEKQYVLIDPVVTYGVRSALPFDWEDVISDDSRVMEFFADAARYQLGSNGMSIPIRSRDGAVSIVSFTSDQRRSDWEEFKLNCINLTHAVAVAIATGVIPAVAVR